MISPTDIIYMLRPASPEARECGCVCPELPSMLGYELMFTDCSEEARAWDVWRIEGYPGDWIIIYQIWIAHLKMRRCLVHFGEIPTELTK